VNIVEYLQKTGQVELDDPEIKRYVCILKEK
jgi:hypothetical protein